MNKTNTEGYSNSGAVTLSYKLGNTTYLVNLKFNTSAEKLEDILLRLIKKDIEKADK